MAEALIGGLSVSSDVSIIDELKNQLERFVQLGVTVMAVDSGLSGYLSKEHLKDEMEQIRGITQTIHEQGIKVIWYIPALEVSVTKDITQQSALAQIDSDWLQVPFDKTEDEGVFGGGFFWSEPEYEKVWLCLNSPYRAWFKKVIQQLAYTGVDGIWLDAPVFDQITGKTACACHYCQDKFSLLTGNDFPERFDKSDPSFLPFLHWRQKTLIKFLDYCKLAIERVNPDIVTLAEISGLDQTGSISLDSENSDLNSISVVWGVDGINEPTAMAGASYDDWIALHNMYKYCRSAAMDRVSWVYCDGYREPDTQLMIASAIAAQNNPYETPISLKTNFVSDQFRGIQFNWIKQYSKEIFQSHSMSPVVVLFSERNRDLLDVTGYEGISISSHFSQSDDTWFGGQITEAKDVNYMEEYRGLSLMLYQNQIPTDIFSISRVDNDVLSK